MATDLTVPQGGVLTVPGRGFEGMRVEKSDLIIPRAKLLQALSPELETEKPLKAGQIINSLTLDVLSPRVVPIFAFKSYFRFNPRQAGAPGYDPAFEPGAMMWRSTDPDDPRVQEECAFGPNGEPPLALTCLNFFAKFEGATMPIVLSFSKTSYKAGKQLLSLARFCSGDMWSRAYQVGAALQKNEKGTYYTFTVTSLGASTSEEQQVAESWWGMFSQKAAELKVHEEERQAGEDDMTI